MKRGRKALAAEKQELEAPLAALEGRNPEAYYLAVIIKDLCLTYRAHEKFSLPPLTKLFYRLGKRYDKDGNPISANQARRIRYHADLIAQHLQEVSASGPDALASVLEDAAKLLRRGIPVADPLRFYLPLVLEQLYGPAPGATVVIPNDVLDLLRRYDVSVHERTVRKEVLKLGYKLRPPGRP